MTYKGIDVIPKTNTKIAYINNRNQEKYDVIPNEFSEYAWKTKVDFFKITKWKYIKR